MVATALGPVTVLLVVPVSNSANEDVSYRVLSPASLGTRLWPGAHTRASSRGCSGKARGGGAKRPNR